MKLYNFDCLENCPENTILNEEKSTCDIKASRSVISSTVFIIFLCSISLIWIILTRIKKGVLTLNVITINLITLITIVEWFSKLVILIKFILERNSFASAFILIIIFSNFALSMILKVFYMGLLEDNIKKYKDFIKKNSRFYKISGILLMIFGPNFSKIFSSELMGIPKSNFEKIPAYLIGAKKMIFFSMIIHIFQIIFDIYCWAVIKTNDIIADVTINFILVSFIIICYEYQVYRIKKKKKKQSIPYQKVEKANV